MINSTENAAPRNPPNQKTQIPCYKFKWDQIFHLNWYHDISRNLKRCLFIVGLFCKQRPSNLGSLRAVASIFFAPLYICGTPGDLLWRATYIKQFYGEKWFNHAIMTKRRFCKSPVSKLYKCVILKIWKSLLHWCIFLMCMCGVQGEHRDEKPYSMRYLCSM